MAGVRGEEELSRARGRQEAALEKGVRLACISLDQGENVRGEGNDAERNNKNGVRLKKFNRAEKSEEKSSGSSGDWGRGLQKKCSGSRGGRTI